MRRKYGLSPALAAAVAAAAASTAIAQTATVSGRVTAAQTGTLVPGAVVLVEGTILRSLSDSAGRYRLSLVPPGPQVLLARRIGFAPARIAVVVPARGELVQDITLAETALQLPELIVTADPVGRARGQLGTTSVIDREAIANQTASSLAGVLELVPGVPLQPPGLDGVQQFALRSVPTNPHRLLHGRRGVAGFGDATEPSAGGGCR